MINKNDSEVVHVMLKPDALEFGLRDIVVDEILSCGCKIIKSKITKLSLEQIESIYSNFEDVDAKPAVLAFFMSKNTEHIVFSGPVGLHETILNIKGSIVNKTGIRGKYKSRDKMDKDELLDIVKGILPGSEEGVKYINFDFFGIDILHSADDQEESLRAIKSVFGSEHIGI